MISRYMEEELEKSRKKALMYQRVNSAGIGMVVLVALVLLIKFIMININHGKPESIFLPTLIATLAVIVPIGVANTKYHQESQKFISLYKRYLVRDVLEEQLDDVEYVGSQGFTKQQIQEFQLPALADYVGSEDYLKATYKDMVFETSDVLIKYTHPEEKDIVYFRGRMLKMPYCGGLCEEVKFFSKNFKFRMDSKAMSVDFFGITQHMVGEDTSTRIRTKDVTINEKFHVFCANEQVVEQLLTPTFIEKIKLLSLRYDSIALRFTEDTLYIAINSNENSFLRYPNYPIVYEYEREKIMSEINEIKLLVDLLCL